MWPLALALALTHTSPPHVSHSVSLTMYKYYGVTHTIKGFDFEIIDLQIKVKIILRLYLLM